MRRFWSEPVARKASRVPSGERIAEGPKTGVQACVHADFRAQAHRLQWLRGFGARSTKPMADAMVVKHEAPPLPPKPVDRASLLSLGQRSLQPQLRSRKSLLNLDPGVAGIAQRSLLSFCKQRRSRTANSPESRRAARVQSGSAFTTAARISVTSSP